MTYAREERAALCALLEERGPAAPTLCAGWRTLDLAAHLVLRERRPDAAAGVLGGPLAGYTRRVQQALIARVPYQQLVDTIRSGPPLLSPYRLPGVDGRANVVEFFVHHEDVRRAASGWEPRPISPGLAGILWQRLRIARLLLRKAPAGVELVRDDLAGGPGQGRVRITAKADAPVVTVTGPPAELTMWVLGRTAAAKVRLDGPDAEVRKLSDARWRL